MSSPGVMALRQVGFEELNHGGSFLTSPTNSKDLISSTKVKGIRYKASVTDAPVKVRKPYTITKQREKWTEDEHKKFLDALKLHGRAWRRIEEHIGTKTAVQIRSHAQKFFSKLEREASLGGSFTAAATREIEIPPPRPKRKPTHPYPKKACATVLNSSSMEEDSKSPQAVQSAFTPLRKGSTTDLNYLGKKLGSSAASLRLFGQTMIQGVEAQEVDTEVIESTGSPRSQVSMDTEETSTVSPVTGHRPLANQIGLSSSFNELAFMQDKSQLIDTDSGWENSPFSVQGTQFMGPPYLTHQMAAFQQGFMSPTFFHATNDDGNTAKAIAAATYAVASAWQAIQGAMIRNANNDSSINSNFYNPTAIPAPVRKHVFAPKSTCSAHEHQNQEDGCHFHEHENKSDGTYPHPDDSIADCCSSLTDSGKPSANESIERLPAKKRKRNFLDNSPPLYESSIVPQDYKVGRTFQAQRDSSESEEFDSLQEVSTNRCADARTTDGSDEKINSREISLCEALAPAEKILENTAVENAEQPLNSIIQAYGLDSRTGMQNDHTTRGTVESNRESDQEVGSSLSECEADVNQSWRSKASTERLSDMDANGLKSSVKSEHTESDGRLFLVKAGASLGSRYSGAGFVPYVRTSVMHSQEKHGD